MHSLLSVQLTRVKDNVFPFIWIGVLCGWAYAKADYLSSLAWLNAYFDLADIHFDLKKEVKTIFFEHMAPNSLIVLMIAVFFLSSLQRIICGVPSKPISKESGMIYNLENFTSLLAISWLGVVTGISLPAWYFDGFLSFLQFMFVALYAIFFLLEIRLSAVLLSGELFVSRPEYKEEYWKWGIKTRFEGLGLLVITALLFTFQHKVDNFFKEVGSSIISYFS